MIETSEVLVDLGRPGTLSIPYVNVVGEAGPAGAGPAGAGPAGAGPRLTVIAGVHGTEYASIAAARELLAELRLRTAELTGRSRSRR